MISQTYLQHSWAGWIGWSTYHGVNTQSIHWRSRAETEETNVSITTASTTSQPVDELVDYAVAQTLGTAGGACSVTRHAPATGEFTTRNSKYTVVRNLDGVDLFKETPLEGHPYELIGTFNDIWVVETEGRCQRLVAVKDGQPGRYVVTTALR
jgi:hypothetical protein